MTAIELTQVCKGYRDRRAWRPVLRDADMRVGRGERIAVLAVPGSGKSTVLRLLSGSEQCDAGRVTRMLRTTWPIPGSSFLSHYVSGAANARFLARFYQMNEERYLRRVLDLSELGDRINDRVDKLQSGMRGQLSIALGLAMDVDVYLFDDSVGIGTKTYRRKCGEAIEALAQQGRSIVIATSTVSIAVPYCTQAYVIDEGRAVHHADMASGLEHFDALMKAKDSPQAAASGTTDEVPEAADMI